MKQMSIKYRKGWTSDIIVYSYLEKYYSLDPNNVPSITGELHSKYLIFYPYFWSVVLQAVFLILCCI